MDGSGVVQPPLSARPFHQVGLSLSGTARFLLPQSHFDEQSVSLAGRNVKRANFTFALICQFALVPVGPLRSAVRRLSHFPIGQPWGVSKEGRPQSVPLWSLREGSRGERVRNSLPWGFSGGVGWPLLAFKRGPPRYAHERLPPVLKSTVFPYSPRTIRTISSVTGVV